MSSIAILKCRVEDIKHFSKEMRLNNLLPLKKDINYYYFGAYYNNIIIGFTSIRIYKNKVYFHSSYVKEEFRNKGIFNTLFKFRIDYCIEKGIKIFEGCATKRAYSTYVRYGFKETGQEFKFCKKMRLEII